MNFYKRHIGDYIKDAAHLSLLEHGVYARLMDVYYSREGGISADQGARLVGARSEEELRAVETVLSEFFELDGHTWRQARCEREIAIASAQTEANRANGKRGGRPKQKEADEKPTGFALGTDAQSEENLSHEPSTMSHQPEETITTTDVVVAEGDVGSAVAHVATAAKVARPACPHQAILALYHELLPMCPGIRAWTPTRAQALRARWNEDAKRQDLDYWRRFFSYVAESEFLTGRAKVADGRKPFVASLDWMVKAENFAKIREGRYHGQVIA